jgi:prenyltransferase beta subunit
MLRAAARSSRRLLDRTARVEAFFRGRLNPDGGFRGRAAASDLYYTVFAMAGLVALKAPLPLPDVRRYLDGFAGGDGLDFVHLTCLARCRAILTRRRPGVLAGRRALQIRRAILDRLPAFRAADGGFHAVPGAATGTVYAAFLAHGAYEDLGSRLPDAAGMVRSVESLATPDGGYANQQGQAAGITTATAAATVVLADLGAPVRPEVGRWLLARAHPEGGFHATPAASLPDLLSTATALHALAALGVPLDAVRAACLDFVESLWSPEGAFRGHWLDEQLDSEYTWYGLVALGHLG